MYESSAPASGAASQTLQDIADACGVTRATVSRAGCAAVPRCRRRDARPDRGDRRARLGYRPNRVAQGLRNRRSHLVGLILTNLVNASVQTMTEEFIQARLDAAGYNTILGVSGGRADQEERLLSMLFERQVDGIVMLGSDGLIPQLTAGARRTGSRSCTWSAGSTRGRATPCWPGIREGAYEATAHLIGLGHTRIALIVGKPDTHVGNERRALAYLRALKDDPGLGPGPVDHRGRALRAANRDQGGESALQPSRAADRLADR